MSAGSKAVIQKEHQGEAVIFKQHKEPNPFENVTDAEIVAYRSEVWVFSFFIGFIIFIVWIFISIRYMFFYLGWIVLMTSNLW